MIDEGGAELLERYFEHFRKRVQKTTTPRHFRPCPEHGIEDGSLQSLSGELGAAVFLET